MNESYDVVVLASRRAPPTGPNAGPATVPAACAWSGQAARSW